MLQSTPSGNVQSTEEQHQSESDGPPGLIYTPPSTPSTSTGATISHSEATLLQIPPNIAPRSTPHATMSAKQEVSEAAIIFHVLYFVTVIMILSIGKLHYGEVSQALGTIFLYQQVNYVMQQVKPKMTESEEKNWYVLTIWVNTFGAWILSAVFLGGSWGETPQNSGNMGSQLANSTVAAH